jgi:hypothetical protein
MTWGSHAIPNTDVSQAPYLAGLHPRDPGKIFVRTDSWVEIDGALTARDALLYSGDGGQTWSELFRSNAKLYGFALSPDGATVLIGYGDPQEGAGQVVSGPFGLFKSATDQFSFEQLYSERVGCLAWTKTGVYLCGSQTFDGFELAFSPTPLSVDAGCWTPLLALDQVRGPLACAAGTSGARCAASWELACATFGACDGGTPVAGCAGLTQPDADLQDSTREASADTAVDASDDAHDASPGTPTASAGGCGCRAATRSPGPAALWALGAWICLLRRRRGAEEEGHGADG